MTGDEETQHQSESGSKAGPRFVPGVVLAGRYRIVSLLGRGGMGEVYRADDLKLEVAVALKFLPEAAVHDERWVERLLGEVRTARKISHPNVCRVYDVGEIGGHHFLSMELIEGEDLASLLRRIGRLPEEKALEIARQLCAGLAAAHDFGVVHRDIKPANVMIDDLGRARITDFGLAAVARDLLPFEASEGTPAYQAPEQLDGREVTLRSDIYALGLVLYELFTGRRPFRADSRAELLRLQMQSAPQTPTSLIDRLDPLIERAILACLRPHPEQRPASPLQIAAMLPGGDPMQAALAAGETPSPDAVACAAAEGSISPVLAAGALAAVVALLIVAMLIGGQTKLHRQLPLPLSPEQLSLRAEQVLSLAGAETQGHQRVYGWNIDNALLRSLDATKRSSADWRAIRGEMIQGISPPMLFWHQTSDELEVGAHLRHQPRAFPMIRPGDTWISLDPRGRIRGLELVPPAQASVPGDVDWRPLLAQTVAQPDTLVPDTPRWRSPVSSDRVSAWKTAKGQPPVRIEAASSGGRPVWMAVLGPDEVPAHATVSNQGIEERAFVWLLIGFWVLAIATGAILAWRNARASRGDRRGAFRLAAILFVVQLLAWVVGGLHLASIRELALLAQAVAEALLFAAVVWMLYMALEPIIRKVWPQRLISWSRALIGSWRDPMVGRDVLAGAVAGLFLSITSGLQDLVHARDLGRDFALDGVPESTLEGFRGVLFALMGTTTVASVIAPFACLTFIVMIGLVVRRMKLAVVIFWLLYTSAISSQAPQIPLFWLVSMIGTIAFTTALVRFGLLAAVIAHFVYFFTQFYPLTPDLDAWFFPVSCFMIALVIGLATYGFITSIGPRRAWIQEEALR